MPIFPPPPTPGANSYLWDFGNGQTSTEENPVITYSEDGTYIISLVTDNKYHCRDTTLQGSDNGKNEKSTKGTVTLIR